MKKGKEFPNKKLKTPAMAKAAGKKRGQPSGKRGKMKGAC